MKSPDEVFSRSFVFLSSLLGSLILLFLIAAASILVGSVSIPPSELLSAWQGQADATTSAIMEQRMNRTLLGLVVGLALGASGALMQAFTRNPLADPGILGVSAGAGFTVTLGVSIWGLTSISSYIWFSFLGSLGATFAVYFIAHRGNLQGSPLRLVLVGMALGAVLTGVSRTIALLAPATFDSMRFWGAGTLANRPENTLATVIPFILLGLLLTAAIAQPLDMLALGEDTARAAGVNIGLVQLLTLTSITLLCGAATAATGPIAFIGLLVPQIVRAVIGTHQPKVLMLSALLAPSLLLGADVLGRVIVAPRELQVGVLASALGAPALIFFIRRITWGKGL